MLLGVTELFGPFTSLLICSLSSHQSAMLFLLSSDFLLLSKPMLVLIAVTNFMTLFLLTLILFLYSHSLQCNCFLQKQD